MMTKNADFTFEVKSLAPSDFLISSVTNSGAAHPNFNPKHLILDLHPGVSEKEAQQLAEMLSWCVGGFHVEF